jgi:hypothetical protein
MDSAGHFERTPDAALFGRVVVHTSGVCLGRIRVILHQRDGDRLALVRRGLFMRRWSWVSLLDAHAAADRIVVPTHYGRALPAPDMRSRAAAGCQGTRNLAPVGKPYRRRRWGSTAR